MALSKLNRPPLAVEVCMNVMNRVKNLMHETPGLWKGPPLWKELAIKSQVEQVECAIIISGTRFLGVAVGGELLVVVGVTMEGVERAGNDVDLEMVALHSVNVPPSEGFVRGVKHAVKETLFPDDQFRQFKNQTGSRKCMLGLQYLFPILEWAPKYSFNLLKSDVLSGITIASLAIPQVIGQR